MSPQPSDPAPTPFYVSGGTLPPDAPSYVPRQADELLLDALTCGEFCYLLDTRQIGKSSLMVRAAARLRAQNTRVALLDLTRIGQPAGAEQWYYGLLLDLGAQLGLRDEMRAFWQGNKEIGPLQRWIGALRQVALPADPDTPLVVFVDEIDNVLNLPFSTDEFFAGIRECYTRRADDPRMSRLTFCLLGSALPDTLIRDVRTTPFNVGVRIEPTDFTPQEAAPLAAGLGRRDGVRLLRRILYWTGGHPYLTQRLCAAVAADPSVTRPGGVDRLCESLFFSQSAREGESNLTFVGSRLLRSTPDLAGLLDTYGHVRARGLGRGRGVKDDPTNALHHVLRLSGVVRVVEGYLWVRNRIYFRVFDQEWVRLHVPDAEARRQRAAFRRGALRAVAAAGVLIALLAGLAGTALHQKGLADVNAAKARVQSRLALANATLANANATLAQRQTVAAQQARLQAIGLAAQRQAALSDALRQKQLADANALRAHTAEAQAVQQAALAHRSADQAHAATTLATLSAQKAKAQTALADRNAREAKATAERANHLLYDADMNLAQKEYEADNVKRVIELLEAHRPKPGEEDLRGFEWGYWWHLCHLEQKTWKQPSSDGSIACSADGKFIAVGNEDGIVSIKNVATGRVFRELNAYPDDMIAPSLAQNRMFASVSSISVTFSPDASLLAMSVFLSVQETNGIISTCGIFSKVFNVADGREVRTFNGIRQKKEGVRPNVHYSPIQFSPDGRQIATVSINNYAREVGVVSVRADTLKLWSIKSGKQVSELKETNGITSIAFSPDGQLLATNVTDLKNVSLGRWKTDFYQPATDIWSLRTGQKIQTISASTAGQFFADSHRYLSLTEDHRIAIWNIQIGISSESESISEGLGLATNPYSEGVTLSPDNQRIAAFAGNEVFVYDFCHHYQKAYIFKDTEHENAIAFSGSGQKILTRNEDGEVKSWNVTGLDAYFSFTEQKEKFPNEVILSPGGERLLGVYRAFHGKGHILVYNTTNKKVVASLPCASDYVRTDPYSLRFDPVMDWAFSSDKKQFAVCDLVTGMASFWETSTWHLLCQLPITKPSSLRMFSDVGAKIAFSPDDKQIAIYERSVAKITLYAFNTKSKRVIDVGEGFGDIKELFFDRWGKHILLVPSIIHGTQLPLYDVGTGKRNTENSNDMAGVGAGAGYPFSAVSADGTAVYIIKGNDIESLNVLTGKTTLFCHGGSRNITMVQISPDRKRMLVVYNDNSLRLWDARTGRELLRLNEFLVQTAAFTSNGRQLVIAGFHGVYTLDASY